MADSRAAVEA